MFNSHFKSYKTLEPSDGKKEVSLEYHMINVGNGLASIIKRTDSNTAILTDSNTAILFDVGVGGVPCSSNEKPPIIIDYLKKIGVKKIDTIFISHYHTDHYLHIDKIKKHFTIKNIFSNKTFYDSEKHRIPTKPPQKNYKTELGINFENWSYDILEWSESLNKEKENDRSLVLYFEFNNISFLLTGDFQTEGEKKLIDKKITKKVTFLQVGHHGSNTATSAEFLVAIKPEVAFASGCDYNLCGSTFGDHWVFPGALAEKRIEGFGTQFEWTGQDGTLIFKVAPDGSYITTKLPHYGFQLFLDS